MASSNERDRNDMEEIEQERTLNRMKVLSSRYFGGGDEEEAGDKNIDDNKSDIFRPISTICGRSAGIRSEFYPGRFGALQHHHHQQHPLASVNPVRNPSKTCFPLFVGSSGVILGLMGLTAYWIVQIPTIRQEIGPAYVNLTAANVSSNELSNHRIFYGIELSEVTIATLIGIAVNLLVVYAVLAQKRAYLVPWLVIHAIMILALIIVFIIVVIVVDPIEYRLFALIPLLFGIYLLFAWIKLVDVYHVMKRSKAFEKQSTMVATTNTSVFPH